jgi:uncharacterized protein (TIGR00299 family) protein
VSGRTLYVDCVAGVAGDMLLGALLDAGASEEAVSLALESLPVDGLKLRVSREQRHGIDAARAVVEAPPQHAHRTWADVRAIIEDSSLAPRARMRALGAFERLAVAEGRVHDTPPEEVHFHEVGAVDAIAEICGAAVALEDLGIDELRCSPIPAPRGLVEAAHGRIPLPAPATLELLIGAELRGVDLDVELVTPTGAALVSSMAVEYGPLPALTLEAIGYGAGARDMPELPNVTRVLVGRSKAGFATAPASLVETNVDDMTPELVPDVLEACMAAGALDAWTTPASMKKGRPGIVIAALARPADQRDVAHAMLRSSTALGVRMTSYDRIEAQREWREVMVRGEAVRVKVGKIDDAVINVAPEHDDCSAVARRTGLEVKTVLAEAMAAATEEAGSAAS